MDVSLVIDQLDRYRIVIVNLAGCASEEEARWRPGAERWSVLEVVNHLTDIEREDFRTDAQIILTTPEESWPDFDIHDWVTARKYNDRELAASVSEFSSQRDQSLAWLRGLDTPDCAAAHSGNGFSREPMRLGDVFASWVAHDLFHIRQLALLQHDILDRRVTPYQSAYSGFVE